MKNFIFLIILISVSLVVAFNCTRENPLSNPPLTPVPVSSGGGGGLIVSTNYYPLYSETYGGGFVFGTDGTIYYWDNSITGGDQTDVTTDDGTTVLHLSILDQNDWDYFGWGITYSSAHDWTSYSNWYLHFSIKSSDITNLKIGVIDGAAPDAYLIINNYGYTNDGTWHKIVMPISDFLATGNLTLTNVTVPFANLYNNWGTVPNGGVWSYDLDNIYLSAFSN